MSTLVKFDWPNDFFESDLKIEVLVWPSVAEATKPKKLHTLRAGIHVYSAKELMQHEFEQSSEFTVEKATLISYVGQVELCDFLSDGALEEIENYYWENIHENL